MKKSYHYLLSTISLILSLCLFFSCSEQKVQTHIGEMGKGGVFMGGVVRLNEVEAFKSLNPLSMTEMYGNHIATQIFEGLVKFDQVDLSIKPAIASRWQSNETQTEWTFHLRKNVVFHSDLCFEDGKGRVVEANDIKYCFDKLCTAIPDNAQYDITFKDRVIGAAESFESSKKGRVIPVSGVKVVDDSTIIISLKVPFAGFLNVLAMPGCWIYPKEAFEKYGIDMRTHTVGTGPFVLETVKEGEVVILKRNESYYGVDQFGNKLPYLEGVKYTFIREKKAEILEFKSGNLDMVYKLPVEIFHDIMGDLERAKDRKNDFQILNSPAFSVEYVGFNCNSPTFSKKEVRLAFNYAIDRHKIADFTIQGEGTAADYGIVPYVEAFEKEGYDFKGLNAYSFDPIKAKKLLKDAGFPDGKGFPKTVLQINSGGNMNILVAEVIQKMLKDNLNIDVEINTVPLTEQIEQVSTGKADLFRLGWSADYPDPETFLTLFYGKHLPANPTEKTYINYFRFKNAQFDSLFSASFAEPNKKERYALLSKAEQIVLDNAPFMPIFYEENFRLEQLNVRNFPENPMNYIDLSMVYLIPKDKMPKK